MPGSAAASSRTASRPSSASFRWPPWSTAPHGPDGSVPRTPTSGTGPRPTPRQRGAGCRTPSGPWRITTWRPTSSTRASAPTTPTRPAPGAGARLLPGAGARPAHRPPLAPAVRVLPGGAVRGGGRAGVRVLLPGLDGRGDPVPGLAHPDVDAVLDLGQDCRGMSAELRADREMETRL